MIQYITLRKFLSENPTLRQNFINQIAKHSVSILYPGNYEKQNMPLMSSGTVICDASREQVAILTAGHVAKYIIEHDCDYIYVPGINSRPISLKIKHILPDPRHQNFEIMDISIIYLERNTIIPGKTPWIMAPDSIFKDESNFKNYIWCSFFSCIEDLELGSDQLGPILHFPHANYYFGVPGQFLENKIICFVDEESADKLPQSFDGGSGATLWAMHTSTHNIYFAGIATDEERQIGTKLMSKLIFQR